MHGCEDVRRQVGLDRPAAVFRHPELAAEKRLRSGRAHEDEDIRPYGLELGIQPGPARCELGRVRLLVDPPLAARLPLEVLDRVRDVGEPAVDSGGRQALVEDASRRADEGLAGEVLLVAGLLADEDDRRALQPLAEDRLRPGFPQVACLAPRGSFAKFRQIPRFRDGSGCHSLAIPEEKRRKRASADHPLGSPTRALA